MSVIAVAGLPGATKSDLLERYAHEGYERFDDVNTDWRMNIPKIIEHAKKGRDVIISDIEFCRDEMRAKLERDLGLPITWICFENDPYRCARNVLYRKFVERKVRDWVGEIAKIKELTKVYRPFGDIRPVFLADTQDR